MAHDEVSAQPSRWGDKLTGRPLPEHDPSIDRLDEAARRELAQHWIERAAAERRVGESFAIIADSLKKVAAPPQLIALAERAVDDERRHTELSRVAASRFAGIEMELPPRLPLTPPEHPGATSFEKHALWIAGQCCFNETLASAVLEASLAATTGAFAKAALRELLSDEIDHARIGWGYLAATPVAREAVGKRLTRLAEANVHMWRTTPRTYPSRPDLVEQGALSLEMIEAALLSALREVLLPGFEQLDFATGELRNWIDQGAPTES